ncbi:MAG TPA: GNAT family N-acetyltransferase [Candidatus Obscuribacterales bacterium]
MDHSSPKRERRHIHLCGEESLNDYLKNRALQARKATGTVTWVIPHRERIIGYYSSVFGDIEQAQAPRKAAGAVHPYPVPYLKIARLAVDNNYKGQGLGAVLVLHALQQAATASDMAGLRMVVVDALKADVVHFYEKFGFKRYDDLSMFVLIKDVKKTLETLGPV